MSKQNLVLVRIALIVALSITTVAAAPGLAQNRKFDLSLGYSYARAESTFESETISVPGESPADLSYCTEAGREAFGPNFQQFFCQRKGMNGFNLAATWNVRRYLGLEVAVAGHFKSESFVDTFEIGPGETLTTDVQTKERLYSAMAGIQLRDNQSTAHLRPFVHALIGAARQTVRIKLPGAFDARSRETSFAMKVGGGLDWRLGERIDLRLIEVNYTPIFAGDRPLTGDGIDVPITIHGRTANNFNIGFGIVVH